MNQQAYLRIKKNKKIYQEAIKFCKDKKGNEFKARESRYPLIGGETSIILNPHTPLISNNVVY